MARRSSASPESSNGRTMVVMKALAPRGGLRAGAPYIWKRRKTVTAFWPPKPKPLMIAVSTFLTRFTFGT